MHSKEKIVSIFGVDNELSKFKGFAGQYGMLNITLYCTCETQPVNCTKSFAYCNLNPVSNFSSSDWCKKSRRACRLVNTSSLNDVDSYFFADILMVWRHT